MVIFVLYFAQLHRVDDAPLLPEVLGQIPPGQEIAALCGRLDAADPK